MKIKKISALLVAAAMSLSLLTPVYAGADDTYLLTNNGASNESFDEATFMADTGVEDYLRVTGGQNIELTDNLGEKVSVELPNNIPQLFNGSLSGKTVYSKWDGNVNVTIDLGGVSKITNVMFWDLGCENEFADELTATFADIENSLNRKISKYTVSVSTDGSNWDNVLAKDVAATYSADNMTIKQYSAGKIVPVFKHEVTSEGVDGRYIKIEMSRASYKIVYSEIAVFGKGWTKALDPATVLSANPLSDTVKTYLATALSKEVSLSTKIIPANTTMTLEKGDIDDKEWDGIDINDYSKLQNGAFSREVGLGRWTSDGAGDTINVDLGAVQEVSDVVVWNAPNDGGSWGSATAAEIAAKINESGYSIKNVTVSGSSDGVNWSTPVSFAQGEAVEANVFAADDGTKTIRAYPCTLPSAINARYLKIEVKYKYQINLAEVMVIGQDTGSITEERHLLTANGLGEESANLVSKYNALGYSNVTLADSKPVITVKPSSGGTDTAISACLTKGIVPGSSDTNGKLWLGANVSWGGYYRDIVIDLNRECYVNGFDVAHFYENNNQKLTGWKLETSANGTDGWKEISNVTVTDGNAFLVGTGTTAQLTKLTMSNFADVKTRYLKVTFSAAYQPVIDEIIVVGRDLPSAEGLDFYGNDGTNDFVMAEEQDQWGTLKAKANIKGTNGTLLVAEYDETGTQLLEIKMAKGTGEVSVDLSEEGAKYEADEIINLKAFVFDGVEDINIISNAVVLDADRIAEGF